jgi:hypothetical protein
MPKGALHPYASFEMAETGGGMVDVGRLGIHAAARLVLVSDGMYMFYDNSKPEWTDCLLHDTKLGHESTGLTY